MARALLRGFVYNGQRPNHFSVLTRSFTKSSDQLVDLVAAELNTVNKSYVGPFIGPINWPVHAECCLAS